MWNHSHCYLKNHQRARRTECRWSWSMMKQLRLSQAASHASACFLCISAAFFVLLYQGDLPCYACCASRNPNIFWPYFFSLTNTVRKTERDHNMKKGIVQQELLSRPPRSQKTKANIKPAAALQAQPPSAGLPPEEMLLLSFLLFFCLLATIVCVCGQFQWYCLFRPGSLDLRITPHDLF